MRIAYLLDAFPRISETFVLNEILELRRQGHDVRIFSLYRSRHTVVHEAARPLVEETVYLEGIRRLRKLTALARLLLGHPLRCLRAFRFARGLRDATSIRYLRNAVFAADALLRERIDHVHVHFALAAAEHAMLASMLTGTPYSVHAHAIGIYAKPRLLREKMDHSAFVATVCHYNKHHLLRSNPDFPPERIHVIRVGVDPRVLCEHLPRRDRSGEEFHLVTVARLVEKKGLLHLVEALARLEQMQLRFRASIAGDGPERGALEAAIRRHRLGHRVRLLGPLEAGSVRELLRSADVFVLPCIIAENGDRDATPTVLGEAMAAEVPVVSTTLAGIPEIVPPEAGILVPPRDIEALTEALGRLHGMEVSERKAMGARGREHVTANLDLATETAKLAAQIGARRVGGPNGAVRQSPAGPPASRR